MPSNFPHFRIHLLLIILVKFPLSKTLDKCIFPKFSRSPKRHLCSFSQTFIGCMNPDVMKMIMSSCSFLLLSVHTVQHYYKTSLNFTMTCLYTYIMCMWCKLKCKITLMTHERPPFLKPFSSYCHRS